MQVYIDGKEVTVLNTVTIVYDTTSPTGITEDGVLEVKATYEGLIIDLYEVVEVGKPVAEHECTATWGRTVDELVDMITE